MLNIRYEETTTQGLRWVELKSINNLTAHTLQYGGFEKSGGQIAVNFAALYVAGEGIPDEFGDPIADFDPNNSDHLDCLDLIFARDAIQYAISQSRLARKERKNSN